MTFKAKPYNDEDVGTGLVPVLCNEYANLLLSIGGFLLKE